MLSFIFSNRGRFGFIDWSIGIIVPLVLGFTYYKAIFAFPLWGLIIAGLGCFVSFMLFCEPINKLIYIKTELAKQDKDTP